MTILSIETSCDETAIAVLDINSINEVIVRANVVSSQIKIHAPFGGVVPNLAAREHIKNIGQVYEAALEKAGIQDPAREIDLICVTHGPGLGPALLVGISFAKTLAWKYGKSLVGTDHMKGHIYSNWLTPQKDIEFPILNLIVSGGHTDIVLMPEHGKYQLVGETLDDAAGEAFDKVARLLDLPYPGGPEISRLALEGNPEAFNLPRPMLHSKDYNFSYAGLKTAVLYLLRDLRSQGKEIDEQTKKDIAASFQAAAIDVLVQKTIRAAQEHGAKTVLLSGGVSANKHLRQGLQKACQDAGLAYSQPEMMYTTDNAAMIGIAGWAAKEYEKVSTDWQTVSMDSNLGF